MKDRIVMITGGAGNLGRAVEVAFAQAGYKRVVVDIDSKALEAAFPIHSDDRLLIPLDLMEGALVEQSVARATAEFGRINVLCNVAGGFYYGEPVHEMKDEVWRCLLDLNVTTLINAVKAVVPGMIDAGRGTVINVGAAAHVRAQAHMSAYAAAKGAVMRLTESMADELRAKGIGVFCVMPEVIDTAANRLDMPDADTSNWTLPSAIADVMLLLTSDASSIMSGGLFSLKGMPPQP